MSYTLLSTGRKMLETDELAPPWSWPKHRVTPRRKGGLSAEEQREIAAHEIAKLEVAIQAWRDWANEPDGEYCGVGRRWGRT